MHYVQTPSGIHFSNDAHLFEMLSTFLQFQWRWKKKKYSIQFMLKLLKMFYCKNLNLISNWYVEITKSDFHASYCKIPNQNPKHNPILISNYYADPEHFKL